MLLKEQGYDEYLAEQIEIGLDDIKHNRVYSLEQAKTHIYQSLERKAAELEELERENIIYG